MVQSKVNTQASESFRMKVSESDRSAQLLWERLKKNADNIQITKLSRIAQ